MDKKISILGGGLFGTALAKILANKNYHVLMWNVIEEEVYSINNLNIHPNIGYSEKLSKLIKSTNSIEEAINYSDIIIISVPSYALENVINSFEGYIGNSKKIFINTSKGFHPQSFMTISKYLKQRIPSKNIKGILSIAGPTFAIELLNEQYTSANLLCEDKILAKEMSEMLSYRYFNVVPWVDVHGGEFLSAYKNMIALLAGMAYGYGFEQNTHAIILTKAINEASLILQKLKYDKKTLLQFCGIGDIILTCSSRKSRNFEAGIKIASVNSINEVIVNLNKIKITVEGIGNASIIFNVLKKHNIDINNYPLLCAIRNILQKKCNIKKEIIKILC